MGVLTIGALGLIKAKSYPTCLERKFKKGKCERAKYECKNVQGLKWTDGGKKCYTEEYEKLLTPTEVQTIQETPLEEKSGLSKGAKIGIGIGAVVILGGILYFVSKKK